MKERFSVRIGQVEADNTIQITGMSEPLRNSIWNYIHSMYEPYGTDKWRTVTKFVAGQHRKVPVDDLPYDDYDCMQWMKAYFYSLKWYEVYELVEFLVEYNEIIVKPPHTPTPKLQRVYNFIFERELSGYRFVSGVLTAISSADEVRAINEAIESSSQSGLTGARIHLKSALKFLGHKPKPDYRNSIKESISAVESITRKISGANSASLKDALRILNEKAEMHGALKEGFLKLYGYTSDEDGIRHAILDESHITFDDAKYMLVSCSAFVNYLIAKAGSANLLPTD